MAEMDEQTKRLMAEEKIEDAVWTLMDAGLTDEDILRRVGELVESCRGDMD